MTLNDFSAPLHQLILFFFTSKSAEVDHGLQFLHLLAESGGLAQLEPSRDGGISHNPLFSGKKNVR
jgi:hypothetical protein